MTQRTNLAAPVSEEDHIQGPNTAAVTLVQYGDYECPYTSRSTAAVRELQRQFGDRLRFVFRNFPLTDIHPHAMRAAEAAESAAAQGRFWEMHDYLFAQQQALEDSNLLKYAADLGLDTARFDQDLATHAHMAWIDADVQSGLRSGVQGTPTFFINGQLYNDSWEPDVLGPALERSIEKKRKL
jgi:protein-disulfide isomerase